MSYSLFEQSLSSERMSRYVEACGGDKNKAVYLYRLNLRLSQGLFTVVGCFEVVLRNAIDVHYTNRHGANWLRDSISPAGMFRGKVHGKTPFIIQSALKKLPSYQHPKLIAEMEFGFWRYLFARHQFYAAGSTLLTAFPSKPVSTPAMQYNAKFFFERLEKINNLRNRLAHHEPVCFRQGLNVKDTTYARDHYNLLLQFFEWLSIDDRKLLYGLDHVLRICNKIDSVA